jgi:hypothetical protein
MIATIEPKSLFVQLKSPAEKSQQRILHVILFLYHQSYYYAQGQFSENGCLPNPKVLFNWQKAGIPTL